MSARAWVLFAVVAGLWGIPYLFIGVALRAGVGPLSIAAGRVLLAAAVLAPFALRGRALLTGRWRRLGALAVVEVVVPFSLIPLGEQTVSSALTGVLIATEPMFVLFTGLALRSRGRPAAAALIGLVVGFAGVVVLLGVAGSGPGVLAIVLAAACYGVGAVLVGRWFGDVAPVVVTAGLLALAAPLLVVLALLVEPRPVASWAGLSAVVVLGLLCTAAGFVAFFGLIARAGPDRASLITYVAPVVAVVCGALLLDEPVGARTVIGTALILAGAWLATRRPMSSAAPAGRPGVTETQETLQGLTAAARADLAADLAGLTDAQWATPSLCSGWTVEEVLAHLTSAATMTPFRWIRSIALAGFRPAVHNRRRLAEHRGATPAETLARFRAVASSTRAPSGHTAAWLGEVVVHGQDIRRPLGLTRGPSVEAATAVAEFFVSRNFAVPSRTVADGLRLEATDGPFTSGDGPLVRGRTEALVMVLAGRAAYLDDLSGDGVPTVRERISGSDRDR